jgi:hypothetical protein
VEKCINQRKSPVKLVSWEDIKMHEIVGMASQTLVRRVFRKRFSVKNFSDRIQKKWEVPLHYVLSQLFLSRSWMYSSFRSTEDVNRILMMHWKWNNTPLTHKKSGLLSILGQKG